MTTLDRLEAKRDRDIAGILDGTYPPAKVRDALADIRVRDVVLWEMTQGGIDAVTLLNHCARNARGRATEKHAPVFTVIAIALWQCGEMEMTARALEAALKVRPDYSLARLVCAALEHGLGFEAWSDSMSTLTRDACRYGVK